MPVDRVNDRLHDGHEPLRNLLQLFVERVVEHVVVDVARGPDGQVHLVAWASLIGTRLIGPHQPSDDWVLNPRHVAECGFVVPVELPAASSSRIVPLKSASKLSRNFFEASSGILNSAFCRVSTPMMATTVPGMRLAAISAIGPPIEWPTRITRL